MRGGTANVSEGSGLCLRNGELTHTEVTEVTED